jgi:hypothetical protein
MNTEIIRKEDTAYPEILLQRLVDKAPEQLYYLWCFVHPEG